MTELSCVVCKETVGFSSDPKATEWELTCVSCKEADEENEDEDEVEEEEEEDEE